MRLQQQKYIFKKALRLLELKGTKGETECEIKNMSDVRDALGLLKDFNIFEPELSNLYSNGFGFGLNTNSVKLNYSQFAKFSEKIEELKYKLKITVGLLEETTKEMDDSIVCIKLAERQSIAEVGDELVKIDKIFSQALTHPKINTSFSFNSVDVGSTWIYVAVGSAIGIDFIGALAWAACVIRKKWLEGNALKEQVRSMKIKNDSMEDLENGLKRQIDELTSAEAKNLRESFDLDDEGKEYENRLIYSITELSKLINEGVQIQPSLMAPEEKQNLFPDYKNLNLITSNTKLLEKKAN